MKAMSPEELIESARGLLRAKGHPFFLLDAEPPEGGLVGRCYNCAREVRLEGGRLVGAAVETLCPQPAWLGSV